MLETKLKLMERKTFDEKTRHAQLQQLRLKNKRQIKKQKLKYSATLGLFAILLFVLFQTLGQSPKPIQSQVQTNFELGELTEASYLYTKRPERIYDLTSPFYSGKIFTADQSILREFELLFENAEVKPFDGHLTNYESSTDYLFQLSNGEKVYLKEIYDNGQSFFVNPNTMMQIELPEENLKQFNLHWMHIYMEKNDFPAWKLVLLTLLFLLIIYEAIKYSKKHVSKHKNSPVINLSCLGLAYFIVFKMTDFLGVNHLLYMFLVITFFMTLQEYLYIVIKKQQPNWKNYIRSALLANLFILVLFL
ncbi:hypothetical protein ACTHOQ_15330 [Solibacillus silvestris]|uniref:hypothetical protein n=1 Tax=Solibacillus silvestris TaxID=76853 RepID=UPI003F7E346B